MTETLIDYNFIKPFIIGEFSNYKLTLGIGVKAYKQVFVLLSIVFISGCSGASSNRSAFPELQFSVNTDLIDTTICRTNSIEFFIPKAFVRLPDSVVSTLKTSLAQIPEGQVPGYEPQQAYLNPQNPGMNLIVSTVRDTITQDGDFGQFIYDYDAFFKERFPTSATTTFTINSVRCWQSRIVEKGLVRFRLVLDNHTQKTYNQLDISFPIAAGSEWGHEIESVLGTIKPTQQKESR